MSKMPNAPVGSRSGASALVELGIEMPPTDVAAQPQPPADRPEMASGLGHTLMAGIIEQRIVDEAHHAAAQPPDGTLAYSTLKQPEAADNRLRNGGFRWMKIEP